MLTRVNGVTDIETSVQTGNNIYPISEQEEIVDVIIGPSKEKVTFNIDTELGKRDINFSRFHTNDNIVLETKQDEIVYLKIVLEKGEYSCAVTPQIRQMGNHLSGNAGTAYASLLA